MEYRIREMCKEDLEAVTALEAACFQCLGNITTSKIYYLIQNAFTLSQC